MTTLNINLKEVFEIIKNDTPRALKQYIASFNIDLESHYYQKYTPLMEAVFLEKIEMVEFICSHIKERYYKNGMVSNKYKEYINFKSTDGKTALMIATLGNRETDIIKYLLMEFADPNLKDNDNKDVYYYSQYSSSEDIEYFWNFLNSKS